ncbi:MAG: hypothetical protein ACI8PT_000269 [Gammaproteobacteria bacterium]|jgi:hypothetical protein
MISLDSQVTVDPRQASSVVGAEVVILDLANGAYFGLEAVGMRVWELLAVGTSVRAVLDVLLAEYDVDAQTCEQDLLALLQALVEKKLVVIEGSASS